MTITPPNSAQQAGFPRQWADDIAGVLEGLIVGESPRVVTIDLPLAVGTYKAYSPVKFDADGVTCVAAAKGDPAIGILLYDIVVTVAKTGVPVLRSGCLNKDMIAWPASYVTDADKFGAFEGAPTPTVIEVRKAYLGSVVPQP